MKTRILFAKLEYPVCDSRHDDKQPEWWMRSLSAAPSCTDKAGVVVTENCIRCNVVKFEWSQVNLERRCAWIHADQAKARKAIPVPLKADAVLVLSTAIPVNDGWAMTMNGPRVIMVTSEIAKYLIHLPRRRS